MTAVSVIILRGKEEEHDDDDHNAGGKPLFTCHSVLSMSEAYLICRRM